MKPDISLATKSGHFNQQIPPEKRLYRPTHDQACVKNTKRKQHSNFGEFLISIRKFNSLREKEFFPVLVG